MAAQQGVIEIPFNEITIVKTLGEGGYGEVILAKLRGINVALKRFKESVEDVSNELKTLTLLRYKFIVTLMGITTDPHTHNVILIMEYMKHGSLEDLLFKQQVKLSRGDAIRLALDIAKGVNYLHSQNPKLIHRDLKSANVLLHSDYKRAKIADFGSATFLQPNVQVVTVIGTYGVAMPPEMLAEEEYSEKADIFSFGVILYEMLTKQRLPVLEEPQRKKRINDNITNDVELMKLVIDCCLTDPSKRPTMEGVVAALKIVKKSIVKPEPAITIKTDSVVTVAGMHPKIVDPKATSGEISNLIIHYNMRAEFPLEDDALDCLKTIQTQYPRCKFVKYDVENQKGIDLLLHFEIADNRIGTKKSTFKAQSLLDSTAKNCVWIFLCYKQTPYEKRTKITNRIKRFPTGFVDQHGQFQQSCLLLEYLIDPRQLDRNGNFLHKIMEKRKAQKQIIELLGRKFEANFMQMRVERAKMEKQIIELLERSSQMRAERKKFYKY